MAQSLIDPPSFTNQLKYQMTQNDFSAFHCWDVDPHSALDTHWDLTLTDVSLLLPLILLQFSDQQRNWLLSALCGELPHRDLLEVQRKRLPALCEI